MKTLIELYDERPIDNVLGTEMFRPQETVLLCPPEVESKRELKKSLEEYFRYRGCPVKLTIMKAQSAMINNDFDTFFIINLLIYIDSLY